MVAFAKAYPNYILVCLHIFYFKTSIILLHLLNAGESLIEGLLIGIGYRNYVWIVPLH